MMALFTFVPCYPAPSLLPPIVKLVPSPGREVPSCSTMPFKGSVCWTAAKTGHPS